MAELSGERATAEANAELDRRRQSARVEFLRSWVEQNGAAVVGSALRVGEGEIVEAVESGELPEGSFAYRAVEGWMVGTGYWEVWGSGEREGVNGDGEGKATRAGYPSVAVYFGRGMETVADGRSRYLMQLYDDSWGDVAVAQDMSGLSRNQFRQAARHIRAGRALSGRIAELIDARTERMRVGRGGALDAASEGESVAPGALDNASDGDGAGVADADGGVAANAGEASGVAAPSPAGSARAGVGGATGVGVGGWGMFAGDGEARCGAGAVGGRRGLGGG